MRWGALVIVAVIGGNAAGEPCPKDIRTKLVGEYDDGTGRAPMDAKRIQIAACVWGKFAGPGWYVEHLVPWAKDSKAEVGPPGGEVFVAKDGTIAASHFSEGATPLEARAIDLDGDGVDEIVITNKWTSTMTPESGERLSVERVNDSKIDSLFSKNISAHSGFRSEVTDCTGKLAIEAVAGGGKQLVVTVKVKHDTDVPTCMTAGRHVFRYTKTGGVQEVVK